MRSDIALGLVTIVMAVLGGIISIYALAKRWQKWMYGMTFVVLGVVGMYFVVRQSNEAARATDTLNGNINGLQSKTDLLQKKLDAFQTWIGVELGTLHSHGSTSESIPKHYERSATENLAVAEGATAVTVLAQTESQRRQAILQALRMEYILSRDNLSPGLLAGIEWPPLDWLNQRLKELKESWMVTAGPTKAELQIERRPH